MRNQQRQSPRLLYTTGPSDRDLPAISPRHHTSATSPNLAVFGAFALPSRATCPEPNNRGVRRRARYADGRVARRSSFSDAAERAQQMLAFRTNDFSGSLAGIRPGRFLRRQPACEARCVGEKELPASQPHAKRYCSRIRSRARQQGRFATSS